MKKQNLIAVCLCFGALLTLSASAGERRDSLPYQYPVRPGTTAWGVISSHEEMTETCQIPAQKLENMTTQALVETILEYPMLGDLLAYNSIQQGYLSLERSFNGMQELAKRPNAAKHIMNVYLQFPILSSIESQTDFHQQLKEILIETMLEQNVFSSQLSEEQSRALLSTKNMRMKTRSEGIIMILER